MLEGAVSAALTELAEVVSKLQFIVVELQRELRKRRRKESEKEK